MKFRRIAVLAAAITMAAATAAIASAPSLVAPVPGTGMTQTQATAWETQMRVAKPRVSVQIVGMDMCSGGVPSCSVGPPFYGPEYKLAATSRDWFYFEMGHIFDWSELTSADRGRLERMWHVRWRWPDTDSAVTQGYEDGLEGVFAAVYQECAEGHHNLANVALTNPMAPPAIQVGHSCQFINSVAHRSARSSEDRAFTRDTLNR